MKVISKINAEFKSGGISEIDFRKDKSSGIKIRFQHLLLIPGLIKNKIFSLLPGVILDFLFWSDPAHKIPASKFFASTGYDRFRSLLDIKISNLVRLGIPLSLRKEVQEVFESGYYLVEVGKLDEIDNLLLNVLDYAKPRHAGARPYYKKIGGSETLTNSSSTYFDISESDSSLIVDFLKDNLDDSFKFYLSTLAGYHCNLDGMKFAISIVAGENSNSEMHQDTFSSLAKGFLYVSSVAENSSPFEYLHGSYLDVEFRSKNSNQAVLDGAKTSFGTGSTRIRDEVLEEALQKYKLKSFVGNSSTLIIANTSGYHRKGHHSSALPRIMLTFGPARKGLISKFIINMYAMIKYLVFPIKASE